MENQNTRAIIIDNQPGIYQDNGLTVLIEQSLPVDSEIELAGDEGNNVVKVILPDSSVGYMRGDEQVHVIQPAWITKDTKLFSSPDETASFPATLGKGTEIELLNAMEGNQKGWVRVRLTGNHIGYIKANVKVITEDSLAESIGELIGNGGNEEGIVNQFVKQGVPATKVREYYQEITRLAEVYKASPEGRKALAKRHARRILYGILWAGGGLIATAISMESSGSGGTYYVFWGAVIWGGIEILRGLFGWIKYSM